MTAFPYLAAGFILNFIAVLFVIVSIALILIILIQKGRGGGLSGAFGGAMASGILGSKTGDFLTWVTIVLVGVFLFLAIILAKYYKTSYGDYGPAISTQGQTTGSAEGTIPIESSVTETDSSVDSSAIVDSIPDTPGEQEVPMDSSIAPEAGSIETGGEPNTSGN